MIDAEVYLAKLLARDVEATLEPGEEVFIAPDIDIAELRIRPALLWTLIGDGQVANGDGLWRYTLTLSIYGEGMDAAKRWARFFYNLVHHWDDRADLTELEVDGDTIWVSTVEDIDLPTRQASADIDGRNVTQYVGSFDLALRN